MGHITNATSFRLNSTVKHKFIFANNLNSRYLTYLQQNLLLLRFLEIFFQTYTYTSSFSNIRKVTPENVNENFLKKLIENPFAKEGFTYSHSIIARGKNLQINTFLFDAELERWRARRSTLEKLKPRALFKPRRFVKRRTRVFYDLCRISKFRFQKRGHRRLRPRNRWFKFKTWGRPKRKPRRRRYTLPPWKNYGKIFLKTRKKQLGWKFIWTVGYGEKTVYRMKHSETRASRKNWIHRKFKARLPKSLYIKKRRGYKLSQNEKKTYYPKGHAFKLLHYFPAIHTLKMVRKTPLISIKNKIKLIMIFLRMFQQINRTVKLNIFFIITIRSLLQSLIMLPKFKPTFLLFKCLTSLRIKEYQNYSLNYKFFKKIFRIRFLFFLNAYNYIRASISTIDSNEKLQLCISSFQIKSFTAAHICNYIRIRLGQYYRIGEIQKPILRLFSRNRIKGFRILVAGRLTRKERAAYQIRGKGSIPRSKKSAFIDYAADYKIMRFGTVGIKVWLYDRIKKPMLYTFRFK